MGNILIHPHGQKVFMQETKTLKKKIAFIIAIIVIFSLSGFSPASIPSISYNNYICGGVTPHHLLAKDVIENFFSYLSKHSNPDTIIILSPDHFNASDMFKGNFISAKSKEFSGLKVDTTLLNKLCQNNSITLNDSSIVLDHGIMNLLPFAKKYFPKASIIPFLVPPNIGMNSVKKLTESINSLSSKNTILIASVDFSHYLPKTMADFHDAKSIRTLINFEINNFQNVEVDSPKSLYAVRYFTHLRGMENPIILAHKNANDYVKVTELYSTTSYFSVVFQKGTTKTFLNNSETILFTGDIMLGREVKNFIEKNSPLYPFENIRNALRGVDLVVGNLEGPISKMPVYFPKDSLKFSFNEDVVKGLAESYFNLLTLSNNHTLDLGEEGLSKTKEILKENNISFVGDPVKTEIELSFETPSTIFLSFNTINQFNENRILETIEKTKKENPDKFLIVLFHWGFEYQKQSSLMQRNLAHKVADYGADLIIGTHPHVVQEIEDYKLTKTNKHVIIFYSLGNFIFDQYFSKETQQGLMVGLELYKDKEVLRLFPVQSKLSQPSLMQPDEARTFLDNLAQISDSLLSNAIQSGVIEIERK